MMTADQYRARALEGMARADSATDPVLREVHQTHANLWADLARKADVQEHLAADLAKWAESDR